MKTEIITCDICGYKFTGHESWEATPASVSFILQSPPRQVGESVRYEHVCWDCIKEITTRFHDAIKKRKNDALELYHKTTANGGKIATACHTGDGWALYGSDGALIEEWPKNWPKTVDVAFLEDRGIKIV